MKAYRTVLALLALFGTSSAFAATAPKATCSLAYSKNAADGTTAVYENGKPVIATEAGATGETKGFKLTAKLERQCAADGGPCGGYDLDVTITQGVSSTYLSYAIHGDPFERVSTALSIKNEAGFVNCDVEN